VCVWSWILSTRTVGHGKKKFHLSTDLQGPKGEQVYTSTLSLTVVLDEDWSSTLRSCRFVAGNNAVPTLQEVGCAPASVWMCSENVSPQGFDLQTVWALASHYTDWAIPAHPSDGEPEENNNLKYIDLGGGVML
jgi:hypothetical protein